MRITLRRNKEKDLRRGYPWVFANQIDDVSGSPESGDVVEIASSTGTLYGRGLYHSDSLIAVRFLTSDVSRPIDAGFFRERLERALAIRRQTFGDSSHYRLINSESDGLPGTIIDRYGDVLTWSTLSFGMAQRRDVILDALEELLAPRAIVERNDAPLREKDSLEETSGVIRGSYDEPIEIQEEGVSFLVDVLKGPKTGFFIDQRINRQFLRRFARGRRTLDVFCADGGFGLHAAAAGAESVHMIDSSGTALERARCNAERNGLLDKVTFEAAEALDRMGEMVDEGASYDLIILDPPAFAKSRRQVAQATKAYQRINITALQMLRPGGLLATSSCSQAISEDDFVKIVDYSVRRSGSVVRTLHQGFQSPDHPVLPSMPETRYLKFFVHEKMRDEIPREQPG
jgi:23S rRNA (cytosine1962-C5)-methyltransferase